MFCNWPMGLCLNGNGIERWLKIPTSGWFYDEHIHFLVLYQRWGVVFTDSSQKKTHRARQSQPISALLQTAAEKTTKLVITRISAESKWNLRLSRSDSQHFTATDSEKYLLYFSFSFWCTCKCNSWWSAPRLFGQNTVRMWQGKTSHFLHFLRGSTNTAPTLG